MKNRKNRMKCKVVFVLMLCIMAQMLMGKEIRTIRILAIGNSFSEDAVEQYLYDLGVSTDYNLIIGNAYRAGQGLSSHWEDVMGKNNSFEYRKVVHGKRSVRSGMALHTIIEDEPWDFITLQQVSQDAGRPDTYEPALSNLIAYANKYSRNAKMKLGFHMTWAYAPYSTHLGFLYFHRNQRVMYDCIRYTAQWVMEAHHEFDFLVPTGTAIQNARTSSLGFDLTRDGYHLDKNIGRYIAACTWYESILRKRLKSTAYRPVTIDDQDALLAQQAAHRACRSPYKVFNMQLQELEQEDRAAWQRR